MSGTYRLFGYEANAPPHFSWECLELAAGRGNNSAPDEQGH